MEREAYLYNRLDKRKVVCLICERRCGKLLIERYIFEVIQNRIKEGRCPECGIIIPGMFV